MLKYTMWTDQIGKGKETDFFPRFTFEAKNQKNANKKALRWARYQNFSSQEVIANIAKDEQLNWTLHNEYVL